MASIHYCPRCSAYLPNGDLEACHRCGADLKFEKDRKDRYEAAIKRKSEMVQGPFHPVLGRKCKACDEDVEILSPSVEEFTVHGEKCGKGPSGDMKAPTQVFIGFQAWRCRKRHKLFSSYELEKRDVCPRCLSPTNLYGKLVRNCTRCGTMVPVNYYCGEIDPVGLMEKRGYIYDPSLE
jgi:hypothetical protein